MLCPKCNANLKDDSTYCVRCGATFNDKKEIINDPSEKKVSFDELIRLYVGENYDKFEDTPFSIWQFLFGTFYSFYRRHYSYGIFYAIIMSASSYGLLYFLKFAASIEEYEFLFKNKFIIPILELLLLISVSYMLSKTYNKKYLSYAGTKVKKIMFSKRNYNAEIQKKKCIQKGRPGIQWIIIGSIIFGLITFIITCLVALVFLIISSTKEKQMNQIGKNICTELKTNLAINNDINIYNGNSFKIESYTNNKYYGLFYINSKEQLVLVDARYNDIICSGTCDDNVKCIKDTTIIVIK